MGEEHLVHVFGHKWYFQLCRALKWRPIDGEMRTQSYLKMATLEAEWNRGLLLGVGSWSIGWQMAGLGPSYIFM